MPKKNKVKFGSFVMCIRDGDCTNQTESAEKVKAGQAYKVIGIHRSVDNTITWYEVHPAWRPRDEGTLYGESWRFKLEIS